MINQINYLEVIACVITMHYVNIQEITLTKWVCKEWPSVAIRAEFQQNIKNYSASFPSYLRARQTSTVFLSKHGKKCSIQSSNT